MKPGIPKGTRDFGPEQVFKRNFIFDTIKQVFVKYGYQPIETPTMELLSTLTGKYGEEGDRLLFRVLKRGDKLEKALQNNPAEADLAEEGLRYDLTVPFARFVVMNQNDIAFPFKRYQIQPVWRADRPQRGRYREFYQCDVDVVGSDSLVYEAELVQIYDEVFAKLGIDVIIKINNRKILQGIAEVAGAKDKFADFVITLDKLDKIGIDGVEKEMLERGISSQSFTKIKKLLASPIYQIGLVDPNISELTDLLKNSEIGMKGIEEVQTVLRYLATGFFSWTNTKNKIYLDTTLARGLSYYTGCIFEVVVNTKVEKQSQIKMGSIGGGGRYDDLTGIFGLKGVSGVGISFGAERIYDVLEELDQFPKDANSTLKVLFLAVNEQSHLEAFKLLGQVRKEGINAALYPEPKNLSKQMKYANAIKVPYVVFINELQGNKLELKNMITGEQYSDFLSIEELINILKS